MDSPPSSRNPLTWWMQGLTSRIAAQVLQLATSSLGLVAALAWNDAVQSVFRQYFPAGSGIVAKFLYAFVVTVLVVLVMLNLTRLAATEVKLTRDK